MPLLDHFHPPLSKRRQWRSFHHSWATVSAFDLNYHLPAGYFADPNVQFGIDNDVVEVTVYNAEAGPVLIGAIELVSPANKDRPSTRAAFVTKCASLLQQGIGLIVVDLVTDRKADLHAELLRRLNDTATPPASELWAASYRPWSTAEQTNLEIWHTPLSIGNDLPTLPFWLMNGPCIKVDLNATYTRTIQEQRLLASGSEHRQPANPKD